MRVISGLLAPDRGEIVLLGEKLTGLPGHRAPKASPC
jgi:ABC-type Fe3+/spermidine/putrescine transport system ATPase subunit